MKKCPRLNHTRCCCIDLIQCPTGQHCWEQARSHATHDVCCYTSCMLDKWQWKEMKKGKKYVEQFKETICS